MEQGFIEILFALLRTAVFEVKLTQNEKEKYSSDMLQDLFEVAQKHDVEHLLAFGLRKNGLMPNENMDIRKKILKAVYRYDRLNQEYENICSAFEDAQIPFLPLKGSVLRSYYPEPWMRTSCDIDILVHEEDLGKAIAYLTGECDYNEGDRTTHDVSLFSPQGVHLELHYDLAEEGCANNAISILSEVWGNVSLHEGSYYWYEMNDEFFYFFHIAHMAKHFETGGCGIRPFIDLWILDHMKNVEQSFRDELLKRGKLLTFADKVRTLSGVWFEQKEVDTISLQMQDFILHGGSYGSIDNRIALNQKDRGGKFGYLMSRIFVPYEKLKRYYPILEKMKWLTPLMQVRRWFMLLNPNVAKMAKSELKNNKDIDSAKADEMYLFLENIGLKN